MNDFIEVTPMFFWQKINPTNAISNTVIKNHGNTKMTLISEFKVDNNLIGRIEEYNFCNKSQKRIYPTIKKYFLLQS